MDNKPKILQYKILFSKDHGSKYVVEPSGEHFCVHGDRWLDGVPEDAKDCGERPVMPSDLSMLVTHGLLGSGDYEALRSKGLVSPTVAKLWDMVQQLKEKVSQLESALPFDFDNYDVDGLPDDEEDVADSVVTEVERA